MKSIDAMSLDELNSLETTEPPERRVDAVVMRDAKNCTNCKYLKWHDTNMLRYVVRADCLKEIWDGETFNGDGDYMEDTTNRQVCELFEYKENA